MAHPFFESTEYPWHRADARDFHRRLVGAINKLDMIDLLYRSCGPGLPPLRAAAADRMWIEALDSLAKLRLLKQLCHRVEDGDEPALRRAAKMVFEAEGEVDGGLPVQVREAVQRALESVSAPPSSSAVAPQYHAIRRQAAVRGPFDPLTLIAAEAPGVEPQPLLNELLRDSTVVAQDGRRLWMMRDDVRREVLAGLSSSELEQATSRAPEDEYAKVLRQLLTGHSPSPEQGTSQLLLAARVAEWIEGRSPAGSSAADAREQLGFAQLLKPFDELLKDGFAGRAPELRQLRDFVGVRPPESFAGWGQRQLDELSRRVRGWKPSHPFVIHGSGGIGKSTLVARFLTEHARLARDLRFPFAYLDFDRASLIPRQPLTLLSEIAHQLSFQFPSVAASLADFGVQQRRRLEDMSLEYRKGTTSASEIGAGEEVARDPRLVHEAASQIRRALSPLVGEGRPFLLVFDTFEEVQQRASSSVAEIIALLESLSDDGRWNALRVVISGRGPPTKFVTAKELALGDLDRKAALALLERELPALGSNQLAKILKHVGAAPLSLKVAVSIVRRSMESGGAVEISALLKTDRSFLAKALGTFDSEQITVQLYSRELDHLRDEHLRKIVNPGFILRRLTWQLIREVLAVPCGLGEVTEERARALFDKLALHISLVSRDRDTLVHRPDVRTPLLKLIRRDLDAKRPGVFEGVNASAVAFHERNGNRVEAIYHRLLGNDVDAADRVEWTSEIVSGLRSALRDLEGVSADMLRAWLDHELGVKAVRTLPPATRRAYVSRGAPRRLAAGDADRALELIDAAHDREDPRLAHVRAAALFECGFIEQSLEVFNAHHDDWASLQTEEARAACLSRAEYLLRAGMYVAAEAFEALLKDEGLIGPMREVECRVGMLMAARRRGRASWPRNENELERAVELAGRDLEDQGLGLLRRLALFVSPELAPGYLHRYFRVAPFRTLNSREFEAARTLLRLSSDSPDDLVRRFNEAAGLPANGVLTLEAELRSGLHEFLVQCSEPRALFGSPEAVGLLRTLLSTRHPEWRGPVVHSLVRSSFEFDEVLEKVLRLPTSAHARLSRKNQARLIASTADEGGALASVISEHFSGHVDPDLRRVIHAASEWDRFLVVQGRIGSAR
ncbi:MAG: AAA family ATPase [Archangium sp.]|nr:AAA family ATPase [Archangium sp.]